jgi:Uma2 family endonuclease
VLFSVTAPAIRLPHRRYTVGMSQPAPLTPDLARQLPADDIIVLRDVTWADYQRLLEIRGDRPVPRLTYLEGALELMTPSRPHESLKSMIGRLVEAWCLERGVGITPYGSWTHESKEAERGVEPDECYVLGDATEPERGDLAIEVIWSSGGLDKLEVYRKLAVREVWIWKAGAIGVHALRGERYVPVDRSEILGGIDLDELLRFVDVRPMTRAVTEYRAAIQAKR